MGCHTWFMRPIKEEEFQLMKEYAPTEIFNLTGKTDENIEKGLYDESLYRMLMKSYKENIPCVYKKYWWQLGYGSSNPKLLDDSGHFFCEEVRGHKGLYVSVDEYWDTFRVRNYPLKVIHSRRELRRWMRKKYFNLSSEQLERISQFYRENLGGVIVFG